MLFEVPDVIGCIPDITEIYTMNETQGEALDKAVDLLDDDIFLESMDEIKTKRWEGMLGIAAFDTDTLADRRFRVQSKVLERMPYTYRVILRKLETLSPGGIEWIVDQEMQTVVVKVALASKNMRDDVVELLENVVPLNMINTVIILYNTYGTLAMRNHGELARFTYQSLHDNVAIGGNRE